MMDLIEFSMSSNANMNASEPRVIQVEMHPVSAAFKHHEDLLQPTKTGSFRRRDGGETPVRTDSSQERSLIDEEELDSSSELPSYSPVPSESASVSWLQSSTPETQGPQDHDVNEQEDRSTAVTPDLLSSGGMTGERAGSGQREEVSQFDTSDYMGSNHSSKDESQSVCSYSSASLPSTSPDLAQVPTPLPVPQVVPLQREPSLKSASSAEESLTEYDRIRNVPENETPIEREIRLAKDREEELRLRNEQTRRKMDSDSNNTTGFLNKSPTDGQKKPSRWSVHIPLDKIPYSDTQRVLATTRLQQEIEQQKRREMELRRDGRVMSISEDRVDHDATNNNSSSDDNTEEDGVFTPVSDHSAHSTPQPHTGIRQQRAFFENGSPEGNSNGKEAVVSKEGGEMGHNNQAIIRQASHPKGEALRTRNGSFTAPATQQPAPVMNTTKIPLSSMQRFISNRGKLPGIVASRMSTAKLSQSSVGSQLDDDRGVYVDYAAVRRPTSQNQNQNPQDILHNNEDFAAVVKKIYRSTKSKIFDELREMERREEELRKTRQDLGLPDLSLDQEKDSMDGEMANGEEVVRQQDTIVQEIAQIPVGRQSVLLAQWEARINSAAATAD